MYKRQLAALKSEDHDPSNSEQTEFADIIDEEEVEEEEARRFVHKLFLGFLFLWLILDPESLFDLVGSIVF